jgi:DDE family transposase
MTATWHVARPARTSIKDLKNVLKADRLSCHRFWANQFRLLLHSAAYVLMFELRRAAHGTELEQAQMDTLRLRLLKIGVQVASTARRIWFHLSSSHPWQAVWSLIARRLVQEPGS